MGELVEECPELRREHDESSAETEASQNGGQGSALARRRARIREAVEQSERDLLRELRECEEEIRAAEAKRGILERLIGYRTRVPGLRRFKRTR